MSQLNLKNRHIVEVLSPEQRKKAQEILNKETGADKSQEEAKARKERSEIRKEKELELKAANTAIRKRREDRRDEGAKDREKNKADKEKRDALKDKQKGLAANVKQKRTEATAAKNKAVAATKKSYETITDKDGDGTALGKMGGNIAKAGGAVAGSVANRIKAFRKNKQADKTQKELDKTKTEQFLYEVETMEKKEKMDKIIDIMRGKNKVEVNPTVKAEEVSLSYAVRFVDEEKKKGLDGKKCWKGYRLAGTKKKGGKIVDNCVKEHHTKDKDGKVIEHEDTTPSSVEEAKVDQGRSDYGKASIRNYRRSGPGYGEPAMFDSENKRGKLIDKRREEHKARRGKKGAKVPAYKVDENVTIQDANGNDFLEVVDLIRPEPIKSPKNNIKFEEAKKPEGGDSRPTVNKNKIDIVMNAVERERKRKNALQIQGIIGT